MNKKIVFILITIIIAISIIVFLKLHNTTDEIIKETVENNPVQQGWGNKLILLRYAN